MINSGHQEILPKIDLEYAIQGHQEILPKIEFIIQVSIIFFV